MQREPYAVDHYENFPVASLLLPKSMRRPIEIVYRFARTADDFADEGNDSTDTRLAALNSYQKELDCIAEGGEPTATLFRDLRDHVIEPYSVPQNLFSDLIDAFRQDVVKTRYKDFDEVLDYAKRSANPVGRIVLFIARTTSQQYLSWSDDICTALQLINFWQDVAIDLKKDRIYIPQEDLVRFQVSEAQMRDALTNAQWRALMQFQIERTRTLLMRGKPLGNQLKGRLGIEIRMTILGGAKILSRLEQVRGDVFRSRPMLTKLDFIAMFFRAIFPL